MKETRNPIYKIRGILMVPPFLFLMLVFFRETEQDNIIWPIGLIIFGVGVLLRVWAQTHLHYRLKVRKVLTTTGPYAYLRNPIYIGNTVMMLGLTVLSELLWFLPVMFLWCVIVYNLVVRREEAHLLEKYGDPYSEFLRNVPRWMPAIRRGNSNAESSNQGRNFLWPSIVAELHCFLWLVPLVAKEWYPMWHR